jgi:hypothetical protein
MRDTYNLYHSVDMSYSGITRSETANDVCLSNVPKQETPLALMYFNKDAYSVYCKKYSEYWEWVSKRNDTRFNATISHGKKYDAKNMMHVFRLLLMAKEIAVEKTIHVFRKDREFLLSIKEGVFEYDELLLQAAALKEELPSLYQQSGLPDSPNLQMINNLLDRMRVLFYSDNPDIDK